ncbi:MAG: radical SAM protein [Burkholderiales bacterium]|nr:radical SAM protein [Burkholderiales bacterium]
MIEINDSRIKVETLEVIVKITERCNINCTYCYYFNGGNTDFEGKPVYIDAQTVKDVTRFLCEAVEAHGIKQVQIDLHGGEPLLLKKHRFREMMQTFRDALDEQVELRVALQTNAMLIDDEWIELFETYRVSVGVSLDGTQADNDTYRLDHQGRGTYDATIAGLRKLQAAWAAKRIYRPGVICVVNPEFDGAAIYRHIVDDLGVKAIHFSSLDYSRDGAPEGVVEGTARFYAGALAEWLKDSNPDIMVRIFGFLLSRITTTSPRDENVYRYVALTIRSDGELSGPDDLRNAVPGLFDLKMNVGTHSLGTYLGHPAVGKMTKDIARLPDACRSCGFARACEAGKSFSAAANRYSFASGFNNRSLYCSAYTEILLTLGKYAVARGVSWAQIEQALRAATDAEAPSLALA